LRKKTHTRLRHDREKKKIRQENPRKDRLDAGRANACSNSERETGRNMLCVEGHMTEKNLSRKGLAVRGEVLILGGAWAWIGRGKRGENRQSVGKRNLVGRRKRVRRKEKKKSE